MIEIPDFVPGIVFTVGGILFLVFRKKLLEKLLKDHKTVWGKPSSELQILLSKIFIPLMGVLFLGAGITLIIQILFLGR